MDIKTQINNLKNYKRYLEVEQATHDFFNKKRYLKINLPVLSPALVPESYLEVFETDFIYFDQKEKLYLTPSPELFLKRLLAYGVGDCYCLGSSFRNSEQASDRHSFEFTMLEFYKVNASYMTIADETLRLIQFIARKMFKKTEIMYQGKKISLTKWEKLTVTEAFEKYAKISIKQLFDHRSLIQAADEKGYKTDGFTYEDIFSQMYVQEVEPHLGMNGYPTLLYDYPKEFAALAKLNPDNKTAQRFEFYIAGVELGDCYTELTDPKEQSLRFKDENNKRKEAGKISHPVDHGFIKALEHGLPDCAGIAIGFERLAMIFVDASTIHQLKLVDVA